ncbi:ACP S-malonyltransferase [Streptomyces sp. cg36]|uniref:ACP S-malonyltransferase n=1 Tax=Streptomyces sp. cg36 TaxID=3238798 RepID=UPI0034E2931D
MGLGLLLGGGVTREPQGLELYQAFPVMRDLYEQIADWCSLPVSMLLGDELPQEVEVQQSLAAVRQAALSMAVHDILAEQRVHPSVIGGLSLGGVVGAALAGAVPRRQMFRLMAVGIDFPGLPASAPGQRMAVITVPDGEHIETYLAGHPEVHPAVWVGTSADGSGTFVVVGGENAAMDRLTAAHPEGVVTAVPGELAIHTPLREPYRRFLAPHLAEVDFKDPLLPLYSGLDRGRLSTADEIRDMFDRNPVEPVHLPYIYDGMVDAGVDFAVIVSSSIPPGLLSLPFPVVHVGRPKDLEKVFSALYELDVRYPERSVVA